MVDNKLIDDQKKKKRAELSSQVKMDGFLGQKLTTD